MPGGNGKSQISASFMMPNSDPHDDRFFYRHITLMKDIIIVVQKYRVQSTLVIWTSVISNNCLSRIENLVLVLKQAI